MHRPDRRRQRDGGGRQRIGAAQLVVEAAARFVAVLAQQRRQPRRLRAGLGLIRVCMSLRVLIFMLVLVLVLVCGLVRGPIFEPGLTRGLMRGLARMGTVMPLARRVLMPRRAMQHPVHLTQRGRQQQRQREQPAERTTSAGDHFTATPSLMR